MSKHSHMSSHDQREAEFDLSVILNMSREGGLLHRTLLSLQEAASYASRIGERIELVAVLDHADDATRNVLRAADLSGFAALQVMEVRNGSLGLSRNDGLAVSRGTYIATADADDLVSFNYFERMLSDARFFGPKTILVPKFYLAFGADYHICELFSLADVSPYILISNHPFVSRITFHRDLINILKYADTRLSDGYAYEDWHFNVCAIAAGYDFQPCDETIVFYRQRAGSLMAQSRAGGTRPIPASEFFKPEIYLDICDRFRASSSNGRAPAPRLGKGMLEQPIYRLLIEAAGWIDGAIDISLYRHSTAFDYIEADRKVGLAYEALCRMAGAPEFDHIFLMPFLTTGGADKYILDVMSAIAHQTPEARFLVLFGEQFRKYAWLDRLPRNTVFIDLCDLFPSLDGEQIDLLCLKLIQATGRKARLHLKGSVFSERLFSNYGSILSGLRPIVYRFCDGRQIEGEQISIEGGQFSFISDMIENIDLLICDNRAVIDFDTARILVSDPRWNVLYASMPLGVKPGPDRLQEAGNMRRLLWASRLDYQKRPSLLLEIARLLQIKDPDIMIDVYGSAILDSFSLSKFEQINNISYKGSFSNFNDLNAADYSAFIYTTWFDGLPNIVLEAAADTVVIAPNVGGIGEFIRHYETGILLDMTGNDEIDAGKYISAVSELFNDDEIRLKLISNARRLLGERHSAEIYRHNVSRILGISHQEIGQVRDWL